MFKFKPLVFALLAIHSFTITPSFAESTLQSMSDEQLSNTTGQALMSLSYIAPTDATNLESTRVNGDKNIGFYKLGLEAELELNANIKKLQLGCGGVNGAGGCDIDIDNLSLSGLKVDSSGNPVDMTSDERVASSAKLTNPFIEFAIKNPQSAAQRQIVGLRLSAEKAMGLLTAGTENSTTPNGINTISGFMRIQSDSKGYVYGKANSGARFLSAVENAQYVVDGKNVTYNNAITGKINAIVATLDIKTTGGGLNIPAMNNIPFIRGAVLVNQNRISSLPLTATLNVPSIYAGWRNDDQSENSQYPTLGTVKYGNPIESPVDWSFSTPQGIYTQGGAMGSSNVKNDGGLQAQITNCTGVIGCGLATIAGVNVGDTLKNAFIKGTIQGIKGDVTIDQGLGYIHTLPINSPVYLSLLSQSLRWPGTYSGALSASSPEIVTDVAQKGWWLSLQDPVNLGSVDPTKAIDIAPLFPQIAAQVSAQLGSSPYPSIGFDGLFAAILGTGDINVTVQKPIDLSNNPLTLNLNNLQLNGQNFKPNCYGSLKFC